MISSKMLKLVNGNSAIRAMFEEGKRLSKIYGEENVFDYSIGNPNVEPPKEIKEIVCKIIKQENPNFVHGYMNNSGYEDVRSAVAKNINKKHDLTLDVDNVVMTCGAAGGLNILFKSLLNKDDEVIIFKPYFSEYISIVNNFDGIIRIVDCNKETFQPDIEQLKNTVNEKTKAVIINTPNNPSGVIYSDETLKRISGILNEKQREFNNEIYLVSDEPYREIVYDNAVVPCILKYYDNSFICYSYSKSLSLPGERIGYIVINNKMKEASVVAAALNISNRILGFVNAPSLFQRVIKEAIDLEVDSDIYKRNRDLLYKHLVNIGFECLEPEGTFYLFPKCPIEDDVKFCEDAKQFNILAVPGSAFGCPGYFRLSYCITYDKIQRSLEAFSNLIKLYE